MKVKSIVKAAFVTALALLSAAFVALGVSGMNFRSVFADEYSAIFTGVNVALSDGIIVKIHTDNAPEGAHVKVNFNQIEYDLTENEQGVFSFYGVAPQQMGDIMTATLLDAENNVLDQMDGTDSFTVKGYLERLLRKTDYAAAGTHDQMQFDALKELCVDLLNYGANAQTYKAYNTEALVNADLTAEEVSLATGDVTVADKKVLSENNTMWLGANVHFDSRLGLLFAFRTSSENKGDKTEVEDYVVKIGEDVATPVWDSKNGFWVVRRHYINVTEMNTAFTASIQKQGEPAQTLSYSLSSYVYAKSGDGTSALSDLVTSAYKFAYSAVAYSQVSYLEPTFTTAGYVRLPDAKGFDYQGTVYQPEELPAITVADYDLNTTLDTEKSHGYSDTNPYIADVYTLKTNVMRRYDFIAGNCVNISGTVYSPNTYQNANIANQALTVSYEEGVYTIEGNDAQITNMKPYGASVNVIGKLTLTISTDYWVNHNINIGTEETEGQMTLVTTAKIDGFKLSNACNLSVINGKLDLTATVAASSGVYALNGNVYVGPKGIFTVDGNYSCPIWSDTTGVTLIVDGGQMTSHGTGALVIPTVKVINNGTLVCDKGMTTKTNLFVGEKVGDASLVKIGGLLQTIDLDVYGDLYIKVASGNGIDLSSLAPTSNRTFYVYEGGTLALETAKANDGTGICINTPTKSRTLTIDNQGKVVVWNFWASCGAWSKNKIVINGSGEFVYKAANLTATTLAETLTKTTVTARPEDLTKYD